MPIKVGSVLFSLTSASFFAGCMMDFSNNSGKKDDLIGSEGSNQVKNVSGASAGIIECGSYETMVENKLIKNSIQFDIGYMNDFLKKHPEASVGLAKSSVSSCADAKEFIQFKNESDLMRGIMEKIRNEESYSNKIENVVDSGEVQIPAGSESEGLGKSSSQNVWGGTGPVYKKGVVEIGGCTGTMINSKYILTSAHCVSEVMQPKWGKVNRTVYYFDPKTNTKRAITNFGEELTAWMDPHYSGAGDVESDIALVKRDATWLSTNTDDYANLHNGPLNMAHYNDFYGRGYNSYNWVGSDTLRHAPITWGISYTHYFKFVNTHHRMCMGDSGGPYFAVAAYGKNDILTGIQSSGQLYGRACVQDGHWAFGTAVSSKVGWIEYTIGATCSSHQVKHTSSNYYTKYKRCW